MQGVRDRHPDLIYSIKPRDFGDDCCELRYCMRVIMAIQMRRTLFENGDKFLHLEMDLIF
jgi:hypothetical protein